MSNHASTFWSVNGVYFLVPFFFPAMNAVVVGVVFAFLCLVLTTSFPSTASISTASRVRFRIIPVDNFSASFTASVLLLVGEILFALLFSGSAELSVGGVVLAGFAFTFVTFFASALVALVALVALGARSTSFAVPVPFVAFFAVGFFVTFGGVGGAGDSCLVLGIAGEPLPAPALRPPALAVGLLLATEDSAPPSKASAAAFVFEREERVVVNSRSVTAAAFFLGGMTDRCCLAV